MTNSAITRVLNKIKKEDKLALTNDFYKCSLGFRRLSCLPTRVRRAYDLAANLETNWDGVKAAENQKNFLGSLTNEEFVNWLKLA